MKKRERMATTPNRLINELLAHFHFKSDRQLSVKLGVSSSEICRLRKGSQDVNASFILATHDCTKWTVSNIRKLAGILIFERGE